MRADPISWMPKPGTRFSKANVRMFLAPEASSISPALTAMSRIMRPLVVAPGHVDVQHRNAEHVSDVLVDADAVVLVRAGTRPKPEKFMVHMPFRTASLYASPKPGAPIEKLSALPPWKP